MAIRTGGPLASLKNDQKGDKLTRQTTNYTRQLCQHLASTSLHVRALGLAPPNLPRGSSPCYHIHIIRTSHQFMLWTSWFQRSSDNQRSISPRVRITWELENENWQRVFLYGKTKQREWPLWWKYHGIYFGLLKVPFNVFWGVFANFDPKWCTNKSVALKRGHSLFEVFSSCQEEQPRQVSVVFQLLGPTVQNRFRSRLDSSLTFPKSSIYCPSTLAGVSDKQTLTVCRTKQVSRGG